MVAPADVGSRSRQCSLVHGAMPPGCGRNADVGEFSCTLPYFSCSGLTIPSLLSQDAKELPSSRPIGPALGWYYTPDVVSKLKESFIIGFRLHAAASSSLAGTTSWPTAPTRPPMGSGPPPTIRLPQPVRRPPPARPALASRPPPSTPAPPAVRPTPQTGSSPAGDRRASSSGATNS